MSHDHYPQIAALEAVARMAGDHAAALAAREAAARCLDAFPDATGIVLKYQYEGDLVYMSPARITTAGGTELWTGDTGSGLRGDGPREQAIRDVKKLCERLNQWNTGGWGDAIAGDETGEDLCLMDISAALSLGDAGPLPLPAAAQARAADIAGRPLTPGEYARVEDAAGRSSLIQDTLDAAISAALTDDTPGPGSAGEALADKARYATGSAITVLQAVHDLQEAGRNFGEGTAAGGTRISAEHSARVLAHHVPVLNRFSAAALALTEQLSAVPSRGETRGRTRTSRPAAGRESPARHAL